MTPLTTNEQALITKMTQSDELARHGFGLLLKRPDFDRFFDALRTAGLFAPERNPAPEPAPEEGYVRIPYWSALDYLLALAKRAGTTNNLTLANAVMDIVRSVSQWRDAHGAARQNYHTAHKFTEILGHVPTAAVTPADLDLIPTWLNDRFERMLVVVALDETVLPHFLASTDPGDWDKAITILHHATAIVWVKEPGMSTKSPRTVIDDHWLRRLLKNHIAPIATKRPWQAVQVLVERAREVYATDLHKEHSTIYRPAIENNEQNHQFRTAENLPVEALRDALLTWAANEPDKARAYLETLLSDDSEILRRIAIYVLDQHWPTLRDLYLSFLQRQPFTTGHLHELYALLSDRFADFSAPEQEATITGLRELPAPQDAKDPERTHKRLQQRWLTAIVGKGSRAADEWMTTLSADPTVGLPPTRADFTSYMTFRAGPGSSPYDIAELVGFANAHLLAERVNTFEEKDPWNGPTLDGLISTLQDAARTNPETFLRALSDLTAVKPLFQQAITRGLQQAWDAKQPSPACNWDEGWDQLITFFEQLVQQPAPATDREHQHQWLLAAIADCLRAGTQHDEHAYPSSLLPRAQKIIDVILQQLPATTKPSDDPMSTAINTPKGRAVEAFVSHALRAARFADQTTKNHTEVWTQLQSIFERELQACKNNNLEFSTLCASYLAQLEYLNTAWTTEQISRIFPAEFPTNDQAAIAGLAYAAFTRSIYERLLRAGVIDRALEYDLKGREVGEKLLERIAAAYIWGIEELDSPRFKVIFEKHNPKVFEQITWVLWTLRHQTITEEQRERILAFWERCITWARKQTPLPTSLLAALSTLATYVTTVDDRAKNLLLNVAPHVHIGHHAYEFFDDLLRLEDTNPEAIAQVLDVMLAAHVPEYDYEDTLQKLLKTLSIKGKKIEVLRMLDRVISLPGMHDLYNELTQPATKPHN